MDLLIEYGDNASFFDRLLEDEKVYTAIVKDISSQSSDINNSQRNILIRIDNLYKKRQEKINNVSIMII